MERIRTLRTKRLVLRPWNATDLDPFAAMNADARVMEFFSRTLDRAQSDAQAAWIVEGLERRGYGLWAVEAPGVAPFLGFVGLSEPSFEAHFTPCLEIGWRLAFEHWGKGFATEAAGAALRHGLEEVKLPQIVSFTVPANLRSIAVMERIGLVRDPEGDFDHPSLPAGHRLRRHVLYRSRPTHQ